MVSRYDIALGNHMIAWDGWDDSGQMQASRICSHKIQEVKSVPRLIPCAPKLRRREDSAQIRLSAYQSQPTSHIAIGDPKAESRPEPPALAIMSRIHMLPTASKSRQNSRLLSAQEEGTPMIATCTIAEPAQPVQSGD